MPSNTQLDLDISLGFTPGYLPDFEDKLFIEGPQTARRLSNFFALLVLAAIIATYGVLSDATATVIGAMLVAPLMTPIIATAAAVVLGSPSRALHSLTLTAAGIVTVILISILLTWVIPDATISFTDNQEISSRTNPGLYALVTAMGAGAAGAFIVSRAELSDSLGGVAIAVALAPPLCVVGISIQQRQWDAATGAFLLFLTNYLATLFAGGFVLMAIGLYKHGVTQKSARFRQAGSRIIVFSTLLLSIPLTLTAFTGLTGLKDNSVATLEVQKWLGGTSYEVVSVEVDDDWVIASVEGSGEFNSLEELEDQLATTLHHPVSVELRWIQSIESNTSSP